MRAAAIVQQPVAQVSAIPWDHNLAIPAKCKQHDEARYYVQDTLTYVGALSTLRDTLLSRLITGQLRVPEAQEAVQATLVPA